MRACVYVRIYYYVAVIIMLRRVEDRVGAAVAAICGYAPGKDCGKRGGAVFVEKIRRKII